MPKKTQKRDVLQPCPKCGVRAGSPCRSSTGRPKLLCTLKVSVRAQRYIPFLEGNSRKETEG